MTSVPDIPHTIGPQLDGLEISAQVRHHALRRLAIGFELSEESRTETGAGQNVSVIRPGENEVRAEIGVALHGVQFVDAAHPEEFAGLAASRADDAVGFLDAWV